MKKFFLIAGCFISCAMGMEVSQKKKPNVILDLHRVLIYNRTSKVEDLHTFFSKKSFLVVDAHGDTFVTPAYLKQFLRFLISRFNIAFFGNTSAEFNSSVVQYIWLKVFNTVKPDEIPVLSENHLIRTDGQTECQPKKTGDISWYGTYKKDIIKIGPVDNTVIVDDELSWILNGQESNLLKVSRQDFTTFYYEFQNLYAANKNKDKATHDKDIQECLSEKAVTDDFLAFYKLLYITGVLDAASENKTNIVAGLRAVQWEDDMPKFSERCCDLTFYAKGYRVLFAYSDSILNHQEIMHLLHPGLNEPWSVLPHELRREILMYLQAFAQREMQLFPEIEKYFC
jgi:hypothetical protein